MYTLGETQLLKIQLLRHGGNALLSKLFWKNLEIQQFIYAIKCQNFDGVYRFLQRGGDVNGLIHDDMSALMYAIECCQTRSNSYDIIISLIINAGAKTNVRHLHNECTPLMLVILYKRSEMLVHQLINNTLDINAESENHKTALVLAIQNDYSENIIKELLNKGADVNQSPKGFAPLLCALKLNKSIEIIKLLINAGANVNILDHKNRNLFKFSCQGNCTSDIICKRKEVTDLLKKSGVDIKGIDNRGNTIIHLVRCNYIIGLAIRNGVSFETQNNDELTPLFKALLRFDKKKVNDLLLLNANPCCVDSFNCTPLHYCDVICSVKLNRVMLYFGANLHIRNVDGNTAIDVILLDLRYRRRLTKSVEAGVKVLLQHYFLYVNENSLVRRFRRINFRNRASFNSYINKCKIELHEMRSKFIKEGLTIYKFCQLKKFYHKQFIPISVNEYMYTYTQIKELFPIYQYLIIMRIKDNSRKKFRRDLIKNLEMISVRLHRDVTTYNNPQIGYDCLFMIGHYLTNQQLFNLFLASLEN